MNRLIIFPRLVASLATCVLTTTLSAEIVLSLKDAFNRASSANYNYIIERGNLSIAQEQLNISRSGYYPQLTLNSSQTRAMTPNVSGLSDVLTNVPDRQYINRFESVIRARFALLNFETIDDNRVRRVGVRIAEKNLENALQSILQEIGFSYFDYWRNGRRLELIESRIERSEALLKIAQNREETGVATSLDVTRAEVDLQENELEKLQQETALLESEMNLKRILAFPLDTQVHLEEVIISPNPQSERFNSVLIQETLANRADYQAVKLQIEQSQTELKAVARERLPSVELIGEWGYAAQKFSDDQEEQWLIGIGVELPLFEGFRTQASQRLTRAELNQEENRLIALKESIEADLRIAYQDKQSRAKQVEVARRNVELNTLEFNLAKLRFEEGVADNSDVVNAQVGLATAEDRLVESEYLYMLSRIRWARVTGNILSAL